jgi:hypothetical protein
MNISKQFRISESKSLQLRIDATNVLNHPTPNNPGILDQHEVILTPDHREGCTVPSPSPAPSQGQGPVPF